jgi:acyl transferase domain-containing protein
MFRHRMALVADSAAGAADLLPAGSRAVMAGLQDYRERPIAFMFPGQGTQHPNMARELYQGEPAFREAVDTCCAKLGPRLGIDLRELLYPPDGAEDRAAGLLAQTRYTQPALFVIEYALAQLLNEWGIRPKAMIGHSVGEYVAACLAGVFTLDEALALIAERGALMQSLPAGTMAAVPLPDAEVEPLLAPGTSIAAVNAPGMCVISGSEQAVEATLAKLGERGVEAIRLRTSHAFHSQMMEPILGPFTERVAAAAPRPPAIPIVSNLTGTWMTDEEAVDPRYWAEHLRRAVRFADGAAEVLRDERHILLEVGPGQTLTGLAGLQPPGGAGRLVLATMRPPQRPGSDLETLLTAL